MHVLGIIGWCLTLKVGEFERLQCINFLGGVGVQLIYHIMYLYSASLVGIWDIYDRVNDCE